MAVYLILACSSPAHVIRGSNGLPSVHRTLMYFLNSRGPFIHGLPFSYDKEVAMRIINRFLAPIILLIAMFLPVGAADAAPAQTERTESFHFMVNDCAGDGVTIALEGTFHVVRKDQKDGSFFAHAKIFGKGVSSSGIEYVLNLRGQARGESLDNFSFEDRTLLISKGPAPNELILFHFDSDTGITVTVECRG